MDLFVDDMVEVQGDINLHGNISSSHTSTGSFGYVSASGDVSAAGILYTTTGVTSMGNISSSADILGARFALSVAGVQHFEVDSIGNVSGSGTGSFVSLNITEDGVKKFNVDTNGHVSASGNISSSAQLLGNALNITEAGDNVFSVGNDGAMSASAGLAGTTLTLATNGATKATIDASGNIAAEGTISSSVAMAATSIEFATNGTPVASISTTGTGSFHGGIDCIGDGKNATGSFGYISASEDVSSSGTLFGENIIAGAGNSIIKGNIKFEGAVLRPIKSITADTVLGATAGVLEDSGKTIVLNKADGCTVTLPAAAGTGASYHFFVGTAISSNSYIIKVADATDTIAGAVHMVDADDDSQTTITAKGTDDTVTLNGGTTSGGALGETLTFTDIATNKYTVQGNLIVPAGSDPADPFSATV